MLLINLPTLLFKIFNFFFEKRVIKLLYFMIPGILPFNQNLVHFFPETDNFYFIGRELSSKFFFMFSLSQVLDQLISYNFRFVLIIMKVLSYLFILQSFNQRLIVNIIFNSFELVLVYFLLFIYIYLGLFERVHFLGNFSSKFSQNHFHY